MLMPIQRAGDLSIMSGLGSQDSRKVDFMLDGFELIKEPLNLEQTGIEWFTRIYMNHTKTQGHMGLVLGATPWMGHLLGQTQEHVFVIDRSAAMLKKMQRRRSSSSDIDTMRTAHFIQGDWLELPQLAQPIDVVLADNAFSFLKYPDQWSLLCDEIADRMSHNASLITRVLSVPLQHCPLTVEEMIHDFLKQRGSRNYSALRASLLFNHWNEVTYAIDTEQVLATFEANRSQFDALYESLPLVPDDLHTITKYRNTGAVYYAPPLDSVLQVFRARFRISEVHFGQYPLAEYFPVIVGVRK